MKRFYLVAPRALLFSLLTSCASVPYTHRKQFVMVSDQQEQSMGLEAYQATLEKVKLSSDCASCHAKDDIHVGEFGRQCQRCHTTVSFAAAKIR